MADFVTTIDVSAFNADINKWAGALQLKLLSKWISLDRSRETKRRQSKWQWNNYLKNTKVMSYTVKSSYGMASAVSIKMAAYAVFVDKGVGKNYKIADVKGGSAKWAGYGEGPRKPNPWFRPVLESAVENLASLVAESYSELSVKSFKL